MMRVEPAFHALTTNSPWRRPLQKESAQERHWRRIKKAERRLERFRRRRPMLGEAADHPLTASLIARRRHWRLPAAASMFGRTVAAVAGFGLLLVMLGVLKIGASLALAVAVPLLCIAVIPVTGGRDSRRLWRCFTQGHGTSLPHLWITPLTYHEILAIDAVQSHCRSRWSMRIILTAIIFGVGGFTLYLAAHDRRLPWSSWLYGDRGLLAVGLFVFLGSLFFLWDDLLLAGYTARLLRNLRDTLDRRISVSSYFADRSIAALVLILWTLVYLVFGGLAMSGISFLTQDWEKGEWGIAFFCAAPAVVLFGRVFLPIWVDGRYARLASQGETLYRALARHDGER
jgi:hypothetical protein